MAGNKLLGTIDFAVGILFVIFIIFHLTGWTQFITVLGILLLVKGIVSSPEVTLISALDILAAIMVLVASSFHIHVFFIILVSGYLIIKGIISWFR